MVRARRGGEKHVSHMIEGKAGKENAFIWNLKSYDSVITESKQILTLKHLVKAMTPALLAVYTGASESGMIPLEEK